MLLHPARNQIQHTNVSSPITRLHLPSYLMGRVRRDGANLLLCQRAGFRKLVIQFPPSSLEKSRRTGSGSIHHRGDSSSSSQGAAALPGAAAAQRGPASHFHSDPSAGARTRTRTAEPSSTRQLDDCGRDSKPDLPSRHLMDVRQGKGRWPGCCVRACPHVCVCHRLFDRRDNVFARFSNSAIFFSRFPAFNGKVATTEIEHFLDVTMRHSGISVAVRRPAPPCGFALIQRRWRAF